MYLTLTDRASIIPSTTCGCMRGLLDSKLRRRQLRGDSLDASALREDKIEGHSLEWVDRETIGTSIAPAAR